MHAEMLGEIRDLRIDWKSKLHYSKIEHVNNHDCLSVATNAKTENAHPTKPAKLLWRGKPKLKLLIAAKTASQACRDNHDGCSRMQDALLIQISS